MKEDGNWQAKQIIPPIFTKFGEECWVCLPPQSIEEVIFELKPGSEISYMCNLKDCQPSLTFIEPGNYRLIFKYGFSKDTDAVTFSEAIDAVTEEIVYSNTFIVKEMNK